MWVSRVHRQHKSLVITLRAGMCRELGIRKGDYVTFVTDADDKSVNMMKLRIAEEAENADNADTGR